MKLYLTLGLIAAVIAGALWLRADAVKDENLKDRARGAESRVQHLNESKDRRNEIELFSNDDLLDRLSGRVRGPVVDN